MQSLPVSEAPAAPIAKNGVFFSLAIVDIAMETPVLEPPSTMVSPSRSAHSRNFWAPRSGLFWWSDDQQLDLVAEHAAAEILDRHLGGFDAAGADHVGIEAGHVVDVADHDLVAGGVGCGGGSARPSNHATTGKLIADVLIDFFSLGI